MMAAEVDKKSLNFDSNCFFTYPSFSLIIHLKSILKISVFHEYNFYYFLFFKDAKSILSILLNILTKKILRTYRTSSGQNVLHCYGQSQ